MFSTKFYSLVLLLTMAMLTSCSPGFTAKPFKQVIFPPNTVDVDPTYTPDDGVVTPEDDGGKISIMKIAASNKCVDGSESSVVQNTCSGKLSQKFRIIPSVIEPFYVLKNMESGLCIDAGIGGQVAEQICNQGSTSQNFKFHLIYDKSYSLILQGSGDCLDLDGGSSDDGATIQSYECNESNSQRFYTPGFVPPAEVAE